MTTATSPITATKEITIKDIAAHFTAQILKFVDGKDSAALQGFVTTALEHTAMLRQSSDQWTLADGIGGALGVAMIHAVEMRMEKMPAEIPRIVAAVNNDTLIKSFAESIPDAINLARGGNAIPDKFADNKIFSTGEAAEICNVSQQTIIRRFDDGRIGGFHVPGSKFRRIPRADLIKFMHSHEIPPNPAGEKPTNAMRDSIASSIRATNNPILIEALNGVAKPPANLNAVDIDSAIACINGNSGGR